ncbi:MAG: class I SAM-dependent methyltransferase, partial [Planctomycetota bacterium]
MSDLGSASYDAHDLGSTWWLQRSCDPIHRRAYRTIANAAANAAADAAIIIDYACGPGLLLAELARRFPHAHLIGLDESQAMLDTARIVLGDRVGLRRALAIELIRQPLPGPGLDLPSADLACFTFPDFRCRADGADLRALRQHYPTVARTSRRIHQRLRRLDRHDDLLADGERLFLERAASQNLRDLLNDHGVVIRADYAPGGRSCWHDPHRDRHDWSAGHLGSDAACCPIGDHHRLFTLRTGRFHRSRVIGDVHAQTGSGDDRQGGYLISVLD